MTQIKKSTIATAKKEDHSPTPKNNNEPKNFFPLNTKTFFPLNMVGISAPPVPLLVLVILLWKHRQIPFWDSVFSVAFPVYLCLANRFRFNNNAAQIALLQKRGQSFPDRPKWKSVGKESWFPYYMGSAAFVGLLLPLLVQAMAPRQIADATAPHLFLLLCQIMMEMMTNSQGFHPILQVTNCIGFQIYGIASAKTWLETSWQMLLASVIHGGGSALHTWETFHFLLALVNVLFWLFNLFSVLLLIILPDCFDSEHFPDANVLWKHQLVTVMNPESLDPNSNKLIA